MEYERKFSNFIETIDPWNSPYTMSRQLVVDKTFLLEKFPGKGGWTYILFPELVSDKKLPFGMRKISGQIDGYFFDQMNLMPFGKGILFLPINAEIRKAISKEAGDWVEVKLYADTLEESGEDLMNCLKDAPRALEKFLLLPTDERDQLVQSIQGIKIQDKKVEKIVRLIEKLEKYP